MAGSEKVYELHGSVHRNYCTKCKKFHDLDFIKSSDGVPRCSCGGIVKPDVVLYEESLDSETIERSVDAIEHFDMLIIGGTSLGVYPAASLIQYFNGDVRALVNLSPTPYDSKADLVINDKLGNVFGIL